MMTLKIGEKEYRVKFGYNCFCDTDLMERVESLTKLFSDNEEDTLAGMVKDLFVTVRELIFVGFKKYNPVENINVIGDLLDDYIDEAPEGETRGIKELFTMLSNELMGEGFLASMLPEEPKVEPEENK